MPRAVDTPLGYRRAFKPRRRSFSSNKLLNSGEVSNYITALGKVSLKNFILSIGDSDDRSKKCVYAISLLPAHLESRIATIPAFDLEAWQIALIPPYRSTLRTHKYFFVGIDSVEESLEI